VDDNASDECPFVIIGSQIILRDCYTNKTEEMQIVSPFMGEIDLNVNSASYLSPMGRAFLLKKIKDDVKVETPMGIFQYVVEDIKLPPDVLLE
jgi:transcription elongation factor GreA